MREGTYYYGDSYSPDVLGNMRYPDALQQKIEWAQITINELQESHWTVRDMYRINRIKKAISDNEKLLAELRGEL